jgi:putative nucleotidyltransferase with HDIG domain
MNYIYNVVMSAVYEYTCNWYISDGLVAALKQFKEETGIEINENISFLNIILRNIEYQYRYFVYPSIFISLLLIISFHVIIKNVKYMNETIKAKDDIKTLSVEVMEALAHTIDAKDEYTRGHSIRVAKYSKMIAERMGLAPEQCEDIYYMGLLHDIGKIGVPNEIINKPTKLTDEEYGVIKTHPATGYDILAEIKSRPDLATGARWHHERYDGKGYPDHMTGEEIPLEARIIAVADSYDAMTSNRSYRNYLPQDVVREEIEKNIGTQFDENAATCMLQIMDEDKEYTLHE